MTSSIFAIHRPIAARRRTETGEQGECVSEGAYASQIALVSDAEDDATGSTRVRPRAMASRGSAGSEERKGKLAEKLEDIFGLDGRESVVAGKSCLEAFIHYAQVTHPTFSQNFIAGSSVLSSYKALCI